MTHGKRAFRPIVALIILVASATAVVVLVLHAKGSNESDEARYMAPELRQFFDSEIVPDEYEREIERAVKEGGLAPERVIDAVKDIRRGDCKASCMGRVIEVTPTALTLEPLFSPGQWSIGANGSTRAFRGAASIFYTELRRGELVEALSSTGEAAELIISFSEPVR